MKSTQIVKITAFLIIIAVFFLSCKQSYNGDTSNQTLEWAYNYVWKYDAKHVIDSLSSMDIYTLSEDDKMLHYLILQHAKERLTPYKGNLPTDSNYFRIAQTYEKLKKNHYASYAYYLFSADIIENKHYDDFLALSYLMKAEEMILANKDIDYQLLGTIYSCLGRVYKNIKMIDKANEYIDKQIFCFKQTKDYLKVASAFRKRAQTIRFITSESQIKYAKENIDSSLYYISIADTNYMLYNYTKYNLLTTKYIYDRDTLNSFKIGKYKCDSLHYPYSARFLTYYYIRTQNFDSAKYYLNISAQDTLTLEDARGLTGYFITEADYEFARKNYEQAAILYRKLYFERERENYLTGQSKAYTLSQQYQLEQEKGKRLEAEKDKWKLLFYSILSCSTLLIIIILATISNKRNKQKQKMHEEKEKTQRELIRKLSEANKEKQEQLKNVLHSRIELTKLYNYEMLKYKNQNLTLPQWALTYIDEGILEKESKSASLLSMTDYSYCNIITYLKKKYPNITEKKLIFIALIINNLSANDISIWMNITEQSVYNQTKRICEFLGVENGTKLRSWLLQLYEQLLASSHLLNS